MVPVTQAWTSRGEQRRNATYQSTTCSESEAGQKGVGKEAMLCYTDSVLIDCNA